MIKGKLDRQSVWIIGISLLILSAFVLFYTGFARGNISLSSDYEIEENMEEDAAQEKMSDTDIISGDEDMAEEELEIYVHVSGEVKSPGVVKLKSGARLYEAVEKAGGITKEGDYDSVNLASLLTDQQKVVIGNINEPKIPNSVYAGGSDAEITTSNKININSAGKTELETLPGIGSTIAQSIIDYRESNNGFASIDDIKNVNRIGDKTFDKIKDMITAN